MVKRGGPIGPPETGDQCLFPDAVAVQNPKQSNAARKRRWRTRWAEYLPAFYRRPYSVFVAKTGSSRASM
jgi:hypothetical protein